MLETAPTPIGCESLSFGFLGFSGSAITCPFRLGRCRGINTLAQGNGNARSRFTGPRGDQRESLWVSHSVKRFSKGPGHFRGGKKNEKKMSGSARQLCAKPGFEEHANKMFSHPAHHITDPSFTAAKVGKKLSGAFDQKYLPLQMGVSVFRGAPKLSGFGFGFPYPPKTGGFTLNKTAHPNRSSTMSI